MNILFIGDIVGSGGRRIIKNKLPELKSRYDIDLVIANAENAAAGLGLTSGLAREILQYGVDLLTLGNHSWAKHELLRTADELNELIRPANVPSSWPGQSFAILRHKKGNVLVINLLGCVFMNQGNDPFAVADSMLESIKQRLGLKISVIDFHAEATSEKNAMAWYLDGRVSLLVGTHTHIQTADEHILEKGTAFITDVGMTGPVDGVIGMDRKSSLRRFVHRLPAPYEVAKGKSALCAVCASVDPLTGRSTHIERIRVDE